MLLNIKKIEDLKTGGTIIEQDHLHRMKFKPPPVVLELFEPELLHKPIASTSRSRQTAMATRPSGKTCWNFTRLPAAKQ